MNYNWPIPIGSVERLQVTNRNMINIGSAFRQDTRTPNAQIPRDLPEESLMLTGDENIADVKFVVIWQIDPVHPWDYAFNISTQPETVKMVAESAMREVIGRGRVRRILTADRPKIEADVQELMQKVLNGYQGRHPGVAGAIAMVDPPEQVIAAFKDVTAAQQDKDRLQKRSPSLCQSGRSRGQGQGRGDCPGGRRLQDPNRRGGNRSGFPLQPNL